MPNRLQTEYIFIVSGQKDHIFGLNCSEENHNYELIRTHLCNEEHLADIIYERYCLLKKGHCHN